MPSSVDKDTACNAPQPSSLEIVQSSNREALREDLIDTAVHFLLNPRVRDGSLQHKRSFLANKGLNEREIDVAVERANSGQIRPLPTPFQQTLSHNLSSGAYVQPSLSVQQPAYHQRELPLWLTTRALVPPVAIAAGICYGLYLFYKRYVEPWLFGQQKKHPLVLIQESVASLTQSMERLRDTLISVETNIKRQIENDIGAVRSNPGDAITLNEIKSEVQSLKALLLNRKQFPATPRIERIAKASAIPEWQLSDEGSDGRQAINGHSSDSSEGSSTDAVVVQQA